MPNGRITLWAMAVGLVLGGAAAPSGAGIDIDFGASVSIGDDTDLYVSVSSRFFDRDRDDVERWYDRFDHPDDLAVALFVSRRSGRSIHHLIELRAKGLTWWEVSARVGVSPDVWFPPVQAAPGPPYGKAYGYWKKRGGRDPRAYTLTDLDARNLVAARMLGEYYRVPVSVAMEWRAGGGSLETIVSREYRERHGHAGRSDVQRAGKQGRPGKGKPGKPGKR